MSSKTSIAVILLLFSTIAFGQSITLPTVLPPSPQSSALIQYNSPQLGLSTGTLQLTIPLFNLKDGAFTLPINLRYSTNGVRVDEIASRVGIGWVLNSGGVITRTVNGRPDEITTRRYPPNGGYTQDASLLSYLMDVTLLNTYDTEPDEFNFNFNGYSGKFILDSNMHPVCMPYTGLKIVYSGGQDNISITTPDGTVYQFSETEYSNNLNFCYGDYNSLTGSPIPTSWYLTSITTKDGDACTFTYDNVSYQYYASVSESAYHSDDFYNTVVYLNDNCYTSDIHYCSGLIELAAKRLSHIRTINADVAFYYTDRKDIPGDKLVSYIELRNKSKLIDKFSFDYTTAKADNVYESAQIKIDTNMVYRPFLTKIHHLGDGTVADQAYTLTYNDINGLPQRASFSQDYFGFNNGKHNSDFLQMPSDSVFAHIFNGIATADRTPDSSAAAKGTLMKIQYPSGGSDSFNYSGNTYFKVDTIPPTSTTINNNLTSNTTYPITQNSSNFQLHYNYLPMNRIVANMLMATDPDGNTTVDPEADLMTVQVLRASDNAVMFSQTLKAGQEVNEGFNNLALNTDYYLSTQVLQPYIKAKFRIIYPTSNPTTANVNHLSAGVRIDRIITNDGLGHNTIKRYYYANLDSLNTSSGVPFQEPFFFSTIDEVIKYGNYINFCRKVLLTSSPALPVYQYGQSSTQYKTVVESAGDNFENGAISHSFIYQRDGLSATLCGINHVLGYKYSNNGYLNNYESQTDYYKNVSGSLNKLKQVFNYYSVNPLVGTTIPAYIAIRHFDAPQHPSWADFLGYELYRYTQNSRWVELDSTKTIDYEGTAPLTTVIRNQYADTNSLQPTQITTTSSKGETMVNKISYPVAMVAAGRDPYGAYQSMINNHIFNIPIEDSVTLNGAPVSLKRSNYTSTTSFQPASIQTRVGSYPVQTYGILTYSGSSLTSVKRADGPVTSYHWDMLYEYPIAECKNAGIDEFYEQTFEELTSGIDSTSAAHSGQKHYNGSFTTADKLTANYHGRNYLISYWYKSSGKWVYSGELTYTGQTLSGDLDDIRIYPSDAQMTTYTYEPLIGMTSATDAKGQTTYYEYDGFQRLVNIKDQYGNIIKHTDYHYQNQ